MLNVHNLLHSYITVRIVIWTYIRLKVDPKISSMFNIHQMEVRLEMEDYALQRTYTIPIGNLHAPNVYFVYYLVI